ncbi:hypothetical protein [Halovivax limisalsi]|uniref:hypothetical protein n=1 Tax=Halovivax limisalsi TaxID=1453760 RepID=UPI001FFC59F8|nr:hypothetical protein [Halovivax limisalsi]
MRRRRMQGLIGGFAVVVVGCLLVGRWELLLPFSLALVVWTRLLGRYGPTDVVLSALAIPCVLAPAVAAIDALGNGPGVDWVGAVSVATAALLSLAVLVDGVIVNIGTGASNR